MRGVPTVVRLAAVRILHRRGAVAVVLAGVAVAVAGVLGAAVAGLAARDAALRDGVERAPAAARAVRVSVFGGSAGILSDLPRAGLEGRVTHAAVLSPERTAPGATPVRVVAIDDPRPWTRLKEGRLPRAGCGAGRCEAVYLGGARRPPAPSGPAGWS